MTGAELVLAMENTKNDAERAALWPRLRTALLSGSRSGEDARDAALDLSRVTRLEVIDHSVAGTGRDLVRYGVRVSLLLQDDGRTLKVRLDAAMGGK